MAESVRPASSPLVNAVRNSAGYAVAAGGAATLSAILCQNTNLTLEQSIYVVTAVAAVPGAFSGLVGSFARNVLHQQDLERKRLEALGQSLPFTPIRDAIWMTLGGALG